MKIYTKKGDSGKTSIIGETDINKHNIRIEAYGTIDELNSHIGLLRSYKNKSFDLYINELIYIQEKLFEIGTELASKSNKNKISQVDSKSIKKLEHFIDNMEIQLPPLRSFILPGGSIWNARVHIARTVCRRAERRITLLNESEKVNDFLLQFMNRLSDYLFVLARIINHINSDLEIKWKS